MKKTKIVIIGAGIAGATAAIYLKRANEDFVLLESNEVGGKLNQITKIENYPGTESTTGHQLMLDLLGQLKNLDIEAQKESVQTILKENDGFEVITNKEKYACEKIILASGVNQKSSLIKGEEEFIGKGVSYCAVCDANFFKGLDVAVIGEGESAIEEALYLAKIVNKVYFISPKTMSGEFKNINNIEVIENTSVSEIIGDMMGVTGIRINDKVINVAGVFPYIGEKTTSQIISNLKPSMSGVFINTNENMETNIKGLYAAGDIVNKKLRQLVTASSDGAIAAISASK